MTTISVVIPTHNRAVILQRALDSALAQRDVYLEVLVVNDGSTDGTSQALAARRDTRIRELRNGVPQHVSAARNRGIREARGEWVALLDDDDLWAPDKLASQLAALGRSGAGWSYTGYVMVDSQLNVLAGGSPPPEDVVHKRMPYEDVIAAGASSIVARRPRWESRSRWSLTASTRRRSHSTPRASSTRSM